MDVRQQEDTEDDRDHVPLWEDQTVYQLGCALGNGGDKKERLT